MEEEYKTSDIQNTKAKKKTKYFVRIGEDQSFGARIKILVDKVWDKRKIIAFGVLGVCIVLVGAFATIGIIGKIGDNRTGTEEKVEEIKGEVKEDEITTIGDNADKLMLESKDNTGEGVRNVMEYLDTEIEKAGDNQVKVFEIKILEAGYYNQNESPKKALEILQNIDTRTLNDEQLMRYYPLLGKVYLGLGDTDGYNDCLEKMKSINARREEEK